MSSLGENLVHARKSAGFTQEAVGEKLGVSRQTISKWESCQSYPDFQRLVLLQGPVDKGGGQVHGTGRDALAAADAHRLLPRAPAL